MRKKRGGVRSRAIDSGADAESPRMPEGQSGFRRSRRSYRPSRSRRSVTSSGQSSLCSGHPDGYPSLRFLAPPLQTAPAVAGLRFGWATLGSPLLCGGVRECRMGERITWLRRGRSRSGPNRRPQGAALPDGTKYGASRTPPPTHRPPLSFISYLITLISLPILPGGALCPLKF